MITQRTKKLAYFAIFLALSFVLPFVVHLSVQQGGRVLLPMHIPIQLAGFILSPIAALVLGIIAPPFNFLVSGMPPFPLFIPMMFELGAMGFLIGILRRKLSIIPTLLIAIVVSKLFLALGWIVVLSFGLAPNVFKRGVFVIVSSALVTGLPGIIAQLILIPPLVSLMKKGATGKQIEHGI